MGANFSDAFIAWWFYEPLSLKISYFEEEKSWETQAESSMRTRGFGVLEPVRGAGFGKRIAVGNIGLEVNNGGAVPGVQFLDFDDVALYADNSAGSEADEVGAFRRPAGKDAGQRVGGIPTGMDLEGLTLRRGIIFMEPIEHPEVGETFKTFQGRSVFRINLQTGLLTWLFHHANGIETDGFDGLSPEFSLCR
jgi:hypothetical protein